MHCRSCRRWEFNPWFGKIPWRRTRLPAPVFFPGESHGQRSPAATVHGVAKSWTRLKWLHTREDLSSRYAFHNFKLFKSTCKYLKAVFLKLLVSKDRLFLIYALTWTIILIKYKNKLYCHCNVKLLEKFLNIQSQTLYQIWHKLVTHTSQTCTSLCGPLFHCFKEFKYEWS